MIEPKLLVPEFVEAFGHAPTHAVFCPGRVNLIGEHLDYNGGPVMPFAIDRGITILARPTGGHTLRCISKGHGEPTERMLNETMAKGHWTDYPLGVAMALKAELGRLGGFDLFFASNLPEGCGLSSSAAIEVGTWTILHLATIGKMPDPEHVALAAQRVEHLFIGVKCGIMDQYAVACAIEGHVIWLNCATLEAKHLPFDMPDHEILVVNTNRPRSLVTSAYNQRKAECEQALADIRTEVPDCPNLASATPGQTHIPLKFNHITEAKRASHVVEEAQNVSVVAEHMRAGRLSEAAECFWASHQSLRNSFEVSCPELDFIVDTARNMPGVWGARMTGAGFGGCAIAIVHTSAISAFKTALEKPYFDKFGFVPDIFQVKPSAGCRSLALT